MVGLISILREKRMRHISSALAVAAAAATILTGLVVPGTAVAATAGPAAVETVPLPVRVETTYILAHPTPLGQVASSLDRFRATPVSFTDLTSDGHVGGNVSRGLSLDEVVARYKANYLDMTHEEEPQITDFRVAGVPPFMTAEHLGLDVQSITRTSTREIGRAHV